MSDKTYSVNVFENGVIGMSETSLQDIVDYAKWLEEELLKCNIEIVNELIDIEVNKQEELDCG